jgi:riboflavin kinase
MRKITGLVFSDLGHAASFMALGWVQKSMQRSLGFAPYPGTLNLRLDSPEELAAWREVRRLLPGVEIAPPDSSSCQARCFLVEIMGRHRGAVILPEVGGYPEDKLEVIAPLRLKDELKLKDGDRVTVEFKS